MTGVNFLNIFYSAMEEVVIVPEEKAFENFCNSWISSKHAFIDPKFDLEDVFIRYLLQFISKLYGAGCIDKSKMLSIYTGGRAAFERREFNDKSCKWYMVSSSEFNKRFNNDSLCENIIKNFIEIRALYNNEQKNSNEFKNKKEILEKERDELILKLGISEKESSENKNFLLKEVEKLKNLYTTSCYQLSAALSSNKILEMVKDDFIRTNKILESTLKNTGEELETTKLKCTDLSKKLENANTLNDFLVKSKLDLENKNLKLEAMIRYITEESNNYKNSSENFANELKKEKSLTNTIEKNNEEKDLIIQKNNEDLNSFRNIIESLSVKLKEFELKTVLLEKEKGDLIINLKNTDEEWKKSQKIYEDLLIKKEEVDSLNRVLTKRESELDCKFQTTNEEFNKMKISSKELCKKMKEMDFLNQFLAQEKFKYKQREKDLKEENKKIKQDLIRIQGNAQVNNDNFASEFICSICMKSLLPENDNTTDYEFIKK